MTKTVTVDGVDYTLSTMTAGDGLAIQDEMASKRASGAEEKPSAFALAVVAASLGKTKEEVLQLPWPAYNALASAALEVNGMKVSPGEAQAGASPAA